MTFRLTYIPAWLLGFITWISHNHPTPNTSNRELIFPSKVAPAVLFLSGAQAKIEYYSTPVSSFHLASSSPSNKYRLKPSDPFFSPLFHSSPDIITFGPSDCIALLSPAQPLCSPLSIPCSESAPAIKIRSWDSPTYNPLVTCLRSEFKLLIGLARLLPTAPVSSYWPSKPQLQPLCSLFRSNKVATPS